MKINVEGEKAVIKANVGDIVYFDHQYWIIGAGLKSNYYGSNFNMCYYLVVLETAYTEKESSALALNDVHSDDELQVWLSEHQAVVYDGKLSSINLVYKQPE